MSYKGRRSLPPAKDGDTHDAFSPWRHILAGMSRPGIIKKIRRRFHKRARKEAKNKIREE